MKDKDKHIRQQPKDAYPQPEIPAEKAWLDMKDMLDEQMPSTSNTFNWIKLLSVIILTCAGLLYFVLNSTDSLQNKTAVNISKPPGATTEHKTNKNASKRNSKAINTVSSVEPKRDHNSDANKPATILKHPLSPKIFNEKSAESIDNRVKGTQNAQSNGHIEPGIGSSSEFTELTHRKPNRTPKDNILKVADSDKQESKFSDENQFKTSIFPTNSDNPHVSKNEASGNNRNYANEKHLDNPKGIALIKDMNIIVSKFPATESGRMGSLSVSILNKRPFLASNDMEIKIKGLTIKSRPALKVESKRSEKKIQILKNVHAGLLWNATVPTSGYDTYFRGINKANDFYKTLIPGIWLGKTFKNGSEFLVKIKPYDQNFGGNRIDTTITMKRDSTIYYYTTSRGLLKTSGLNIGLQYNHQIYHNLSIGIGTNMQWQKNALYSNQVKSSRKNSVLDYIPYVSLLQKADTSGYLKPYFFTGNLEILYRWKKLQFIAGVNIPVTSMISSQKKLRPVSGQVTVRWWVR